MSNLLTIQTPFWIVVLFCSLAVTQNALAQKTIFTMDAVTTPYEISLPIDTAREAVEFAKAQGLLQKPPYDKLAQQGFFAWTVIVKSRVNFWQVTVKTDDLLPSYSCTMKFDFSGNIFHSNCGYHK